MNNNNDDNKKILQNINDSQDKDMDTLIALTCNFINDLDFKDDLLSLLNKRLEKGQKEYGHGIRINDDTRNWGTSLNSWKEMALEELLDAIIYLSADNLKNSKTESEEIS